MTEHQYTRGDWISTGSGNRFYPLDPRPEDVTIVTIAFALSNLVRFGGHVRGYSVAEHCVHVSNLVSPHNALWGLLHDASEAYLGDVVRPIKPMLLEYRRMESAAMDAITLRFNIGYDEPDEVRYMDTQMLVVEHDWFFPGEEWNLPERTVSASFHIHKWSAERAEQEFLSRYHVLNQERRERQLAANR